MVVCLVRHGETENNNKGLIQGRENHLLSDSGRRQCQLLKMRISNQSYDVCFTSPLVRCTETAIILIGDRVPMILDERLIERDMGKLEGRDFKEYNAYQFWDYDLNWNKFQIEAIQDVFSRCQKFLDYLKKDYSDSRVLVVTHGATYRALRYLLRGTPLKGKMFDGYIKNCQYEEFEV